MMLKPWIFIAAALLTCASQANAGEITEADLKAVEIILAKMVLANCQNYQPEVKVFLADNEKKLEADKWYEIDLIEQARIKKTADPLCYSRGSTYLSNPGPSLG